MAESPMDGAVEADLGSISSVSVVDDSYKKIESLFLHLKIAKVVFVDDRALAEVDSGAVFRFLATLESPQDADALVPIFPGVELSIDNDALMDQVGAILTTFDSERFSILGRVLSARGGQSDESDAHWLLRNLLPQDIGVELLTPHEWHAQRSKLIEDSSAEQRVLFLFDQELGVDTAALGFTKGSDIIRNLAEQDKDGFGSRWFCGMLTHTVAQGAEVSSWLELERTEQLDLQYFMPIAKGTLDDAQSFYEAIYRTLINTYCQRMKHLAQGAFEEALREALERIAVLDPIAFEHMVVKSSETEGVSELETLIRLYGIIQKDHVKSQILQQATIGDFSTAAQSAKAIANIGRSLSPHSQERLHRLRWDELYESEQLINRYNDPLRNGDIFEIGEGGGSKLWVLIAQPCDLMVRSDGKRVREDNFKVAVLAPLKSTPLGEEAPQKSALSFSLDHYDHGGAQASRVLFAEGTPANLHVLDLAVFNKDGRCALPKTPNPAMNLPSQSWEKRDVELRRYFGKVTKQIESARRVHNDQVASLLAEAVIPRAAPGKKFLQYGSYNDQGYSYPIRRCARIRDPLAAYLLNAYSRFLARDAYEHDFSR